MLSSLGLNESKIETSDVKEVGTASPHISIRQQSIVATHARSESVVLYTLLS